jgi:Trypsin-co-occurring domain 1
MDSAELADKAAAALVPLDVDGKSVYLEVRELPGVSPGWDQEREIAGRRRPSLDQVLDGLMSLARAMGAKLQQSDASKVAIQFGCDIAMETGGFVAVIGKASVKSTFTVSLEWSEQAQ